MCIQYGDWSIVRKIGSGSFGTVYEIERETLGFVQKAALKVISIPQSDSEIDSIRSTGMDEASIGEYYRDIASQIMIELKTMEQLKGHTNIVSYEDHEVRQRDNGFGWDIYIRMELLTPLSKYMLNHSVRRDDVIRLGIDLCRALERCEALNIIHRDIKPDNIFLSRQGDAELGDFGIARTVERTMSGMSKKGTYSYMAPEVYMGQPYGKSVDIYSLGLVLYRLLNYNRGPFLPSYPNPIKFNDQEQALMRRIKGERLPEPVQADQRLAKVVLKACSFDPAQRYSTAKEMRLALQALRSKSIPSSTFTEAPSDNTAVKALEDIVHGDDDTVCGNSHKMGYVAENQQPESGNTDNQHSPVNANNGLLLNGTQNPLETEQREVGTITGNHIQNESTVSIFQSHNQSPNNNAKGEYGTEKVGESDLLSEKTTSVFPLKKESNDDTVDSTKHTGVSDNRTVNTIQKTETQTKIPVHTTEEKDLRVGLHNKKGMVRATIGAIVGALIHYSCWVYCVFPYGFFELYYFTIVLIPLLSWFGYLSVKKIENYIEIFQVFIPTIIITIVCVGQITDWLIGESIEYFVHILIYVLLGIIPAIIIKVINQKKNKR